jgi:hypothetical protein
MITSVSNDKKNNLLHKPLQSGQYKQSMKRLPQEISSTKFIIAFHKQGCSS